MKIEPLSVTYARALMELAAQEKKLRPVLEEVRAFAKLLRENRDFKTFLEIPSITTGAKLEALQRVFRGKMDDLVLNFIQLVVKKKRQALFGEIFAECEVLYDEAVGRLHVEATTALPLPEAGRRSLVEVLKGKTGRDVVLINKVRPEVLGGLVLRYRDLVADDSIRHALDRAAALMLSHKLGSELIHENQS